MKNKKSNYKKNLNDEIGYARFRTAIDSDSDYEFDSLCRWYDRTTPHNKKIIDYTFMYICGYTLKTLRYDKDNILHLDIDPKEVEQYLAEGQKWKKLKYQDVYIVINH